MKKILLIAMSLVICVGLMGAAFAYFTDTQTSSNNVFTGGNVHLMLSNSGPYSDANDVVIGTATNMAPGHESGPYYMYFKNTGSVGGLVAARLSYNRTTKGDAFAQLLIIDQAYSSLDNGVTDVAPWWAQQLIDSAGLTNAVNWKYVVADSSSATGYYPTVFGLQTVDLKFTNGYNGPGVTLAANGGVQWDKMSIKLDPTTGNDYENFGITIAVTATLTSN